MSRKNSREAKAARRAEREARAQRQTANNPQQEGPPTVTPLSPLAALAYDLDADKGDLAGWPPRQMVHRSTGQLFTAAEVELFTSATPDELKAAAREVRARVGARQKAAHPRPDIPFFRGMQTLIAGAEGLAADMRRLTALLTAYPPGPAGDVLAAMPPEEAQEAAALIQKLDAAGIPAPTLENWQEP